MAIRRKRTIVGSPLTPMMLIELGAVDSSAFSDEVFYPEGNWVNTYRIWTCHGYRESGNANNGILKIERQFDETKGIIVLKVEQKIVQREGSLHLIRPEIHCNNDRLASPLRWDIFNSFTGPDGKVISDLSTVEHVELKGDRLKIKTGRRTHVRNVSDKLTGDWCLFDAVQRMPFKYDSPINFNVLEGMSLMKKNHTMSYRGLYRVEINGKEKSLHSFRQLGFGILPYDYYLNSSRRLIMVITLSRAYILDPNAESKIKSNENSEKIVFRNTQKKYQGMKSNGL